MYVYCVCVHTRVHEVCVSMVCACLHVCVRTHVSSHHVGPWDGTLASGFTLLSHLIGPGLMLLLYQVCEIQSIFLNRDDNVIHFMYQLILFFKLWIPLQHTLLNKKRTEKRVEVY